MTYAEARILSFDDDPPRVVEIEETSHWRLPKSVREHPERFWKALREEGAEEPAE